MPVKPNALLSKKVKTDDRTSRDHARTAFGVFVLLSLLLLIFFLDMRLKKTTTTSEDYLTTSFDAAVLPSGYQSNATLHYDGTSGYLHFDALNQTLRTPELGSHASYRVNFRVAVLNVASPEPYNETSPTITLSAYDETDGLVDTFELYDPQVNTTYTVTFSEAEDVSYFIIKFNSYANIEGYQATAGIDDLIVQTPRED